jgi:hypothetical protein
VDDSTALTEAIADLLGSVDSTGARPAIHLRAAVATLARAVRRVAPSYQGLAISVIIDGHRVSLTAMEPSSDQSEITTSLHLTLGGFPLLDPTTEITFYAATPGTFIDLGADLTFALGAAAGPRLDQDLPTPVWTGVTGIGELSDINVAIGILIGHDHTPETARRELHRIAAAASITTSEAAARVRANPSDPALRYRFDG